MTMLKFIGAFSAIGEQLKEMEKILIDAYLDLGKKISAAFENKNDAAEEQIPLSAWEAERMMALPIHIVMEMWDEYGVGLIFQDGRASAKVLR